MEAQTLRTLSFTYLRILILPYFSQSLRNRGNEEAKKLVGGYKSREWDRNRSAIMQLRKSYEENEKKYDEQVKAWQLMFEEDDEDF